MDNVLIYADMELVEDPGRESPGRVQGVLVTYGEQAVDRPDVYEPDSLSWPEDGIVLNEVHERSQLIKRFTPYQDGRELKIDLPLPPTQRGRDAAVLLRDKTYTGLSIEVVRASIVSTIKAGVRHISKGTLAAAALVDKAAFTGSVVAVHAKRESNRLGVLRWL